MPVSAGVRHGIVPLTSPRLAAENAANAEPRASKNAVSFHGLKKVLRTGRSEAAARTWAANEMNDGRDETLITTNEKNGRSASWRGSGRFQEQSHPSSETCPVLDQFRELRLRRPPAGDGDKFHPRDDLRPVLPDDFSHLPTETVTGNSIAKLFSSDQTKAKIRHGLITKKGQYKVPARQASTLRLDHREVAGFLQTKAGRQAHERSKRRDPTRLSVLLDVALEVNFHALWHETLAADAAAATKDVAAIFGLHAGAEAKLLFPGALGGLIGSFGHKTWVGESCAVTGSRGRLMINYHGRPGNWGAETTRSVCFVKCVIITPGNLFTVPSHFARLTGSY
jgi:hypothetical protein